MRRGRRAPRLGALALLWLMSAPAWAEPALTVTAEIRVLAVSDAGEATLRVGEPFLLVIEARHAPGAIAVLPEEVSLGEALGERRPARRLLRRDEAGAQIDRYELELVPFDSGALTVPAIPLALGSTTASSPALELDVTSSLDEEAQPVAASTRAEALAELERLAAANPAPRTVEIPDHRPLWALGALVLAGLLAWAILRWRARARAAAPLPPPAPPRPAHEAALERLGQLLARPRDTPERQKAYYVDLSEIVRGYVGERYGFDSIELTVAELLLALEGHTTPGLDRAQLRRLLDTADLVKFAKLSTDDDEALAHGRVAVALVEATRARPAPEAAP